MGSLESSKNDAAGAADDSEHRPMGLLEYGASSKGLEGEVELCPIELDDDAHDSGPAREATADMATILKMWLSRFQTEQSEIDATEDFVVRPKEKIGVAKQLPEEVGGLMKNISFDDEPSPLVGAEVALQQARVIEATARMGDLVHKVDEAKGVLARDVMQDNDVWARYLDQKEQEDIEDPDGWGRPPARTTFGGRHAQVRELRIPSRAMRHSMRSIVVSLQDRRQRVRDEDARD